MMSRRAGPWHGSAKADRGLRCPQNVVVVDAFGALLAELGPQGEAIDALKRAVQLAPDSGFEKYMCGGLLTRKKSNRAYVNECETPRL